MSNPVNPAVAPAASMLAPEAPQAPNEEALRHQLRAALQGLKRREPLDPTYKRLIQSGVVTSRRPVLPKDKFYRRVGSNLRGSVEAFLEQTAGKDPFDRISQRKPLDNAAMRAALTLREAKEHEQQPLLDATLAAFPRRNGMDDATRKRKFDAIAAGLQSRQAPKPRVATPVSMREQTEQAQRQAELEKQRKEARGREAARRRREEEDRKRREDENERQRNQVETPQQALHKVYQPIFKKLWEMEFVHLGGTNPFRIVIDRDNCASVGAPDYFDIIDKPMNLTYIQQKVDNMEYDSLAAFTADVELMLTNALLYNSDTTNPYRVAAEEMKKKYHKIVKKVLQTLKGQRK